MNILINEVKDSNIISDTKSIISIKYTCYIKRSLIYFNCYYYFCLIFYQDYFYDS